MSPVRLIRPQAQHTDHIQDPWLSMKRGGEEGSSGSLSGFWKSLNFFFQSQLGWAVSPQGLSVGVMMNNSQ